MAEVGKLPQAVSLICTEVFLRLTHQRFYLPETFWCNFRNWGENCPHRPPFWLRAWSPHGFRL